MGRTVPSIPNPHTPRSASEMKDVLGEAIARKIRSDATGTTVVAALKRYKSLRAGDVANVLSGDHQLYGINRLLAFSEALGLDVRVEVRS